MVNHKAHVPQVTYKNTDCVTKFFAQFSTEHQNQSENEKVPVIGIIKLNASVIYLVYL